jgi:hypothetical protein
MNTFKRFLCLVVLAAGCVVLTGCTITPGIDLGLDFDYYGGKFHVSPSASVGIHGRP